MIEKFNEVEVRNSGLIYKSSLDQIKMMYEKNPEKAGELAISIIELILTGQISSDDEMIEMLLITMKEVNKNNIDKYNKKVETTKQKKIQELKLQEIADLYQSGVKQKDIGNRLGLSQ
jgi:hypothetical protein